MWLHERVPEPVSPSLLQRLNLKIYYAVLFLAAAFVAVNCFRPLLDNVDMGWHVAQGRWMVQHLAIYRTDVMNYANRGHPLVNEYPFFQVVVYGAGQLGWWGLYVLTAGIYASIIWILARAARSFQLEGSSLFALTLAAMLLYFQIAFPLRPHLFTYLGVGLLGVFLLRHRNPAGWIEFWPMALLQIAWTNSHSAFVLGPLMVGLFGFEMTVRHSCAARKIAWPVARVWVFAFLFILLACFVNPFGIARFYPAFYQGQLEEIRAYVSEMQPLSGIVSTLIGDMTWVILAAIAVAAIFRRGAISYSFLFIALLLYLESFSVMKSWPVFGIFPALLVLSMGAFGDPARRTAFSPWGHGVGNILVSVFLLTGLEVMLAGNIQVSIPVVWREYNLGRRELPYPAIQWMLNHGIKGRLFHRCEDGGELQRRGYDHGETFGDTGFGKYDERMIHLVAMIGERPALLPAYLAAYRPGFIECNSVCFRWPYHLRRAGWRPIFYSVSSSVWTRPETRPDLPTISGEAMEASFLNDIARHGRPPDALLYGRDLMTLNSAGCEDFVFAQLTGLPAGMHRQPWYWEAARILCFETPAFSVEHRRQLQIEAEALQADALTGEFRAFTQAEEGDPEAARKILEALPTGARNAHGNDLLLKIDNDQHRPEALALAESSIAVDLRDGEHWAQAARAQQAAGNRAQAAADWRRAVFYYPDDDGIMAGARAFSVAFHDTDLARTLDQGLDFSGG